MPSGAVSPAEPVTGLNMAKSRPLPARRRLSSGLSGAYKFNGRRRKTRTAGLCHTTTQDLSYNIHL
ncbi:hypothetical protein QE443_000039 [Pantoea ananatis]|nr:hypothetical protein [Pantoea ananatis]MDR6092594.1 hypothetical protein [Pantoea ananatis]PVY80094.1 hypothetical protein C7427_1215 [Pantoea ananatis]PWV59451.1 hypothetical protein C7425_11622 [Pantoea ananatis]PWV83435.1 hypothetical protein C7426_1175 [Pantoea ananatis]